MANRMCISEEAMGHYLAGHLRGDEREQFERHLSGCDVCLSLLVGAYKVIKIQKRHTILQDVFKVILVNGMLCFSVASLAISFFLPGYFLQLLILSVLSALKWMLDKRPPRTLIAVRSQEKKRASR